MKKTLLKTSLLFCLSAFSALSFHPVRAQVLYGTATSHIVRYNVDSNTLVSVHEFESPVNGAGARGGLVQVSDGKFYGMTYYGGTYNAGVIYSFDPETLDYTKRYDFDGITGAHPWGCLMEASNGKLYGMTSEGGSGTFKNGVIFCYDPVAHVYTKLVDLSQLNYTSGALPFGHLVQAANGLLYGMIPSGGNENYGIIFSYNIATSEYKVVKHFDNLTGAYPYGSLVPAKNGKLYGMTNRGGLKDIGMLFSFAPSTSLYSPLASGDPMKGQTPYGDLMQAVDGKLYGLAATAKTNTGVAFSFDIPTYTYRKLQSVDYFNQPAPRGGFMQAGNGILYGTSYLGGTSNQGYIFSLDPLTNKLVIRQSFNGNNGSYPLGTLVEYKPRTARSASRPAIVENIFEIKTGANPSPTAFSIQVKGDGTTPIYISVNDVMGRRVYETKGPVAEVFSFGSDFVPGMYVATIRQGNNSQTIRLVKSGR